MVMDKHGRSHKPSGLPQGVAGTYDTMNGVGIDDDLNTSPIVFVFTPQPGTHTSIQAVMETTRSASFELPTGTPLADDERVWFDAVQWAQEHDMTTNIIGINQMSLQEARDLAHAQNTILCNHIATTFDKYIDNHRFFRGGKRAVEQAKQNALNTYRRQDNILRADFTGHQREVLAEVERRLDDLGEQLSVRPLRTNPAVVRMIEEHPELAPYVNPQKHDASQAGQILIGLETGVDISQYNDPDRYDDKQMNAVYWGLREKVDVSQFNNPERYTAEQMHYVEIGLRDGLDVSKYNNPERFSAEAMARAYWRQRNARDQYITPLRGQHFGRR